MTARYSTELFANWSSLETCASNDVLPRLWDTAERRWSSERFECASETLGDHKPDEWQRSHTFGAAAPNRPASIETD